MANAIQPDAQGYRKFGMRDNLAYAAGDFGCNMSFALKGTMFVFWTQFMQMDTLVYSGLLLLCQLWDAINDPLIGIIIDNDKRRYRHGKFLAYIKAGSVGLLLGGACCFLPFPNAPAMTKNFLFVGGYIIWDAFYTVANVPYGSLLSVISENPGDRASLSAWRSVGAVIGIMVPMVLLPFLMYQDNVLIGNRVFFTALIMGMLGFLAFRFMIRNTVIRVDTEAAETEIPGKRNIINAVISFMKNRAAVGVTIAAMGMFLVQTGSTAAVTVMFQSYFGNVKFQGITSLFAMLPIILFTPVAGKLVLKYGKKELSSFGSVICIIVAAVFLLAPVPGNFIGILMFIAVMLVYSIGMGCYSTVCWALMGDAIDYNARKTGVREEGTIYSLHSFFRKLAQGITPSLCGVLMTMVGYTGNPAGETMAVATNIRYLVAGLYLAAGIIMFLGLGVVNNLSRQELARMNDERNARRA